MNLLNRIKHYLIGIILGVILVYFLLFKNRDRNLTSWFPSEVIKKQIKGTLNLNDEKSLCIIRCTGFSEEELLEFIEQADVNMSESSPRKKPRIYQLEQKHEDGRVFYLLFELDTSKTTIIGAGGLNKRNNCDC